MEKYNEIGQVICQECGKALNIISPTHLKTHTMNLEVYRKRYPDFPLASKSFGAKQKFGESELLNSKTTSPEIEVTNIGEIDLDKIPSVPENLTDSVSSFIEEVKTFGKNSREKSSFDDMSNIHKNKVKILNFLVNHFPDLKDSYFVEKRNPSGSVISRLVTDMASPLNKIDFEFPNTFWHNIDVPKIARDSQLRMDGWIILDFSGNNPSLKEIEEALKKNNLI